MGFNDRKLHIGDWYDNSPRCPHCNSEDLGVSFNFTVGDDGIMLLDGDRMTNRPVVLICEACGEAVTPEDTRNAGRGEEDKKEKE